MATAMPLASSPFERLDSDFARFEAPYVVDKLFMNKTVATREEARRLFEEAKRYLLIVAADPKRAYPLPSLRVDEAWHQFVLFSIEYTSFCERFFGRYLHHAPSNAPSRGAEAEVSWNEFAGIYAALFGAAPPLDLWDDAASVCLSRRVIHRNEALTVRVAGESAELHEAERGLLVRVDRWAAPALEFLVERGIFYVRELPGLESDDKIALARVLVRLDVLRVAP